MYIKFLDLYRQYLTIKPEIDDAIANIIKDSTFSGGKYIEEFEKNFAKAHDNFACVAVSNGTIALYLAIGALLPEGSKIIVPANTFIATAEAISANNCIPIFVDCDETYTMDVKQFEQLAPTADAVIPVHLYGHPVQMTKVMEISKKHNLIVIEDCAQAHFAKQNNQMVGTTSAAGAFSFFPSKNLGAMGEGGAIIMDDELMRQHLKAAVSHGSKEKYKYEFVSLNYRMCSIQAAILDVKLKHLQDWTNQRRLLASIYFDQLSGVQGIKLPIVRDDVYHVYHLFVIRTGRRDELKKYLQEHGIETGIHYPIPCHKQPAYEKYSETLCPRTEFYAKEILSLPLYPELDPKEIDYICRTIKTFFKKGVVL